jgi:hypothetical protein
MNLKEAIQAILDGKKVCSLDKHEEAYFFFDENKYPPFCKMYFANNVWICTPMRDAFYIKEWKLYKEKTKMHQYVVQNGNNRPTITKEFYEDISRVPTNGELTKVIQRADWTEIEVEV